MPLYPQRAKTRQKTKPRRRPAEPRRALRKTSMWRNMPILHPGTAARRALHKTGDKTYYLHPRPPLRAHSGMPGLSGPRGTFLWATLGPCFLPDKKGPMPGALFQPGLWDKNNTRKASLLPPNHFVVRTIFPFIFTFQGNARPNITRRP